MSIKQSSMENTLVSLKSQIQKCSQELQDIDNTIFLRNQELARLNTEIEKARTEVVQVQETVSTVVYQGNQKLEDIVSRRNNLEVEIRRLETDRFLIEIEIEQKKNTKIELPSINFANQVFEQVKKNVDILTSQTESLAGTKTIFEKDIAALSETKAKIDEDIAISNLEKQALASELDALNAQRELTLKALAEEQAKTQALAKYERDVRAMHKQLTEQFQNVYKPSSRRSTI